MDGTLATDYLGNILGTVGKVYALAGLLGRSSGEKETRKKEGGGIIQYLPYLTYPIVFVSYHFYLLLLLSLLPPKSPALAAEISSALAKLHRTLFSSSDKTPRIVEPPGEVT